MKMANCIASIRRAYLVVINVLRVARNKNFLFNPCLNHSILLRLVLQTVSNISVADELRLLIIPYFSTQFKEYISMW